MTWPSGDVDTTGMDSGTDPPPRAEFLSWAQKFNQLINHVTEFMQGVLASATAADARTALDVPTRGGGNATGNWNINVLGTAANVTGVVAKANGGTGIADGSNLIQPGDVAFFFTSSAPLGYLKANGAAVSRTVYAGLFAAIGTTAGPGDGSTTFNVPDLRGEFLRAWDDGRGIDVGRTFGSAQADAFQAHKHEGLRTSYLNNGIPPGGNDTSSSSGTTNGQAVASTAGTPRTAGETRPRNVALLVCIKY